MNPWMSLMLLPGLAIGLTLHEFAHAWSASLLGDDYARRQGRVSLNPFRHLSLLGTLALLVLPLGWARPVPVNLYNFKRPRRDYLLTSLAGPAANAVVVAVCIAVMYLTRHTWRYGQNAGSFMNIAFLGAYLTAVINAILATFNLLPIPPLDGSKIWPCLFPRLRAAFSGKWTWVFILVLLVGMQSGSFGPIIDSVLGGVGRLMPVSDDTLGEDFVDAGAQAHERGDYSQAESLFTEGLALLPYNDHAYSRRAMTRIAVANWAGAGADLDRAIELAPTDADYYEARALVRDALGQADAAQVDRVMAEALREATGQLIESPKSDDLLP